NAPCAALRSTCDCRSEAETISVQYVSDGQRKSINQFTLSGSTSQKSDYA
ncbi:12297_t:CDS:2, partial [Racocetra persica]